MTCIDMHAVLRDILKFKLKAVWFCVISRALFFLSEPTYSSSANSLEIVR